MSEEKSFDTKRMFKDKMIFNAKTPQLCLFWVKILKLSI